MAGERPTSGIESNSSDFGAGRGFSFGSDSARPTIAISSLRSNGLGRYSYAPRSEARMAVMNVFCALIPQKHIADDQIAVALTDPAPQRGGIAGGADFIAGARQRLVEHGPDRRIVVRD